MRKFGLLIVSFLVAVAGFAQQVSGIVKDQQGKSVPGSTVSLLNAKDSSVVKLAATNNDGQYSFHSIKTGKYLVGITHVGYANSYSSNFEVSGSGETNVPAVALNKLAAELKGV